MAQGPVYDNALRLLAVEDLVAVCRWLGIDADPKSLRLSEALPAATQHADLITQIGPDRLVHVEFVRAPTPDLPLRMLEYRARIMRRETEAALTQHVVVLAQGTVPDRLTDAPQLTLSFHVTYLRDQDPGSLLRDPALAPLAVLARAESPRHRSDTLRRALASIADVPDPSHRHNLAHAAAVLAGIHLDPVTIEAITQEAHMPITLEGTVAGNIIAAAAEARGRVAERARTMTALLHRSFGDDPRIDDLAHALARLPHEQALDTALTATTLDDLAHAVRSADRDE